MFVESYERLNIFCNIGPRNKTKFNVRKEDKSSLTYVQYVLTCYDKPLAP